MTCDALGAVPAVGGDPAAVSRARDEVRAAGTLAGEGVAGIVGVVGEAHLALAARVETFLPEPARRVAAVTRTIAAGAYGVVGIAGRVAPIGVAEVIVATSQEPASPIATGVGRAVLPIANGLWGDRIAERGRALAIRMAVRSAGGDLALDPADVARAFPAARSHVVVLIHGLFETELSWRPRGPEPGRSFGEQLMADLPVTALEVRYNTGAGIAVNAEALARLLDDLVAAWPVAVERITLVGHSMGGLVAREACVFGRTVHESPRPNPTSPWAAAGETARDRDTLDPAMCDVATRDAATQEAKDPAPDGSGSRHPASVRRSGVELVDLVISLGAPHGGAPLAKVVHAAELVLAGMAETRPYARVLGTRSAGVRDLRHGPPARADTAGPRHRWIAATITSDRDHPAGWLVGDGLVRYASASDRSGQPAAAGGPSLAAPRASQQELPNTSGPQSTPASPGVHLGGVNHASLQYHSAVYKQLRAWIGSGP